MTLRKICILTETFHPVIGGGETQARALAEGLAARGAEVFVLTRRSSRELERHERLGGVTVCRLPPSGASHLNKWAVSLTTLPALFRLRGRFDVVLVSGFRVLGMPALLACKILGKACVLKADSLGEMSGEYFAPGLSRLGLRPASAPFRWFLAGRNALFRRADAFVAISAEIAGELHAHGVPAEAIHTIPNSVDTERFRPVAAARKQALREKLGLPRQARVVCYTGRLVSYKGLPLLLEAWRELCRERDDAILVLVGSGGVDIHNCEAELVEFVAAHGLERQVRFVGNVRNVDEYLQASDVFAFPSENEAFGISLIEAMACGLPVVSSNMGGLRDIVEHEVDGLAVEAGNREQLRRSLDRLLADPALGARLGETARKTAEQRYAADGVADRYAHLFQRLTDPAAL